MAGNSLQVLHCFKSGVCRTLPVPHPCVSTSCTLTEDGFGDFKPEMEWKNSWLCFSLLSPSVCSSAHCYSNWTRL
uniref:Uncharacterized protein n=1 Tax=Vitis vinifera TaxID=29760 RepID=F6HK35_VITVI